MIRFGDIFEIIQTQFSNGLSNQVIQILITVSPVILSIILLMLFAPLWLNFIRSEFIYSLKYTLLQIKLPKELMKSPLAMEVFLSSLHNVSEGGFYTRYWKGEMRPFYTLEIVSIEGSVKFFIRTEDRRKNNVIAALYSQFPGIEINEAPDYTLGVQFDPKENKLWGAEFIFTKPDPYPIKTYIDYGLDKDPKEEFKVDPMVPMIEFLGSVGFNQQIWIQYMIRGHKGDQRKPGHIFKLSDSWKDEAKELVDKLMSRDAKTKVAGKKDKESGRVTPPTLSEGEKDVIGALDRSITKLPFDVGIRTIYIGKKDFFDKPNGIGGIISSFKQFSSENLNGFKPNGDKWSAKFKNTPWEDYKSMRANKASRLVLEAYKRRCFFVDPFKGDPMVMNTEELATVYHFPGQVAATPNLDRIPSKKGQAPSNLPI